MNPPIRKSTRWIVVLSTVALLCLVLLQTAPVKGEPTHEVARVLATGPKIVFGYVNYSDGVTPAGSAAIVATVWNGTTLKSTLLATTDSSGFYLVTFGPFDWGIGDLIVVGATLGGGAGEGNAVADDSPTQTINVTLDVAIPEFSMPVPIIGAVVAALFLLMGRRIAR